MLVFQQGVREYLEEERGLTAAGCDPRLLMADGGKTIKEVVWNKMERLGSRGKAQ